jgi:hypothetical protein
VQEEVERLQKELTGMQTDKMDTEAKFRKLVSSQICSRVVCKPLRIYGCDVMSLVRRSIQVGENEKLHHRLEEMLQIEQEAKGERSPHSTT